METAASSDLSEFEGRRTRVLFSGNEVVGEFDQPCVRVRSLVLLNLFLLDCEGWFLPLPGGHCCERWECGLLSILDSQVHIKHHAKEVLPWKYIFTFPFGIFLLFKLRHSLFVIKAIIEFRQRSDEDEAFMYSKSSWSNWSRHCVTACLAHLSSCDLRIFNRTRLQVFNASDGRGPTGFPVTTCHHVTPIPQVDSA